MMIFMADNILVTGGAGFLGSHLCERLLKDSSVEKVHCLDNLQTGNLSNIEHLNSTNRFVFAQGDVIDGYSLAARQIWNLACAASPPLYQKDPVHTFKTSVYGTENMANLALEHGARLFHTSTSEVYGDPLCMPQSEEYWGNVNPIGIRSCYDEGKRAAETLLFDMKRMHGLDLKVVRIFNTYGPRMSQHDGRVVSNFIVQALKGEDITIYGDGSQTRSFCYVDDLIDAFMRVMSTPESFSGPVNTGNPNEFSITELAEKVLSLTCSKSSLVYRELPQDDPKQRCPDISLAKETCDWEPKVSLEDGLKETIAHFRAVLQA